MKLEHVPKKNSKGLSDIDEYDNDESQKTNHWIIRKMLNYKDL